MFIMSNENNKVSCRDFKSNPLTLEEIELTINNTIASASINQRVDLKAIAKHLPNVKYQPHLFPGLIYRVKTPKTAVLMFDTGKIVCTGGKGAVDAYRAVMYVMNLLRKCGVVILTKPTITIQNLVVMGEIGGELNLEDSANVLKNAMYEPEQFPGIIHTVHNPKAVILLFASGKFVCTGLKTEREIREVIKSIHDVLEDNCLICRDYLGND